MFRGERERRKPKMSKLRTFASTSILVPTLIGLSAFGAEQRTLLETSDQTPDTYLPATIRSAEYGLQRVREIQGSLPGIRAAAADDHPVEVSQVVLPGGSVREPGPAPQPIPIPTSAVALGCRPDRDTRWQWYHQDARCAADFRWEALKGDILKFYAQRGLLISPDQIRREDRYVDFKATVDRTLQMKDNDSPTEMSPYTKGLYQEVVGQPWFEFSTRYFFDEHQSITKEEFEFILLHEEYHFKYLPKAIERINQVLHRMETLLLDEFNRSIPANLTPEDRKKRLDAFAYRVWGENGNTWAKNATAIFTALTKKFEESEANDYALDQGATRWRVPNVSTPMMRAPREVIEYADWYTSHALQLAAQAEKQMNPELKKAFQQACKDLGVGKKRLDQTR
jgi:hypothetical protein